MAVDGSSKTNFNIPGMLESLISRAEGCEAVTHCPWPSHSLLQTVFLALTLYGSIEEVFLQYADTASINNAFGWHFYSLTNSMMSALCRRNPKPGTTVWLAPFYRFLGKIRHWSFLKVSAGGGTDFVPRTRASEDAEVILIKGRSWSGVRAWSVDIVVPYQASSTDGWNHVRQCHTGFWRWKKAPCMRKATVSITKIA